MLEQSTGKTIPRGDKIETGDIGESSWAVEVESVRGKAASDTHMLRSLPVAAEYIRLSTTVATNALLERRGEKHALVVTKGL